MEFKVYLEAVTTTSSVQILLAASLYPLSIGIPLLLIILFKTPPAPNPQAAKNNDVANVFSTGYKEKSQA